ncbi:MraY family glycosyltransferase [Streptomyces triticagri]|uniref:MraY family glycosyltransferase n=1 Tax=Streptomyces triticagri TaxID=2293568 RepID=UPI00227981A7|nr:MraY family glycosyltransferase [Streptomyces triticagri]
MLYGTVAVLAAVLLTAVLSRGVRALCLRTGVLDRPGGRKVHARPTPHLGGLAVAAGTFVVCCTGYAPLGDDVRRLLWAAGAVALLGLVDDLRPLGPGPRLVVETGAACAVVFGSGLSPAAGLLAVGWIVFVTNAFNLLDNSDGAVGTVGAVTAIGLALCAGAGGHSGLALLLLVLAAALAGFLTLNWHPARLFLGDCGALFTGFVLGSAGVLVHAGRDVLPSAAALFALSCVVIADTVLVVASRRRAGRPLLRGGTDHIAHRLRRIGFTVPGAAVVLGAAAVVGCILGVLVHREALGPSAALPLLCATAAAVLALLRVRVYGRRAPRGVRGGPGTGVRPAPGARGGAGPRGGAGVRSEPGARGGGGGVRVATGRITGPRSAPRTKGGVPATRAGGGGAGIPAGVGARAAGAPGAASGAGVGAGGTGVRGPGGAGAMGVRGPGGAGAMGVRAPGAQASGGSSAAAPSVPTAVPSTTAPPRCSPEGGLAGVPSAVGVVGRGVSGVGASTPVPEGGAVSESGAASGVGAVSGTGAASGAGAPGVSRAGVRVLVLPHGDGVARFADCARRAAVVDGAVSPVRPEGAASGAGGSGAVSESGVSGATSARAAQEAGAESEAGAEAGAPAVQATAGTSAAPAASPGAGASGATALGGGVARGTARPEAVAAAGVRAETSRPRPEAAADEPARVPLPGSATTAPPAPTAGDGVVER